MYLTRKQSCQYLADKYGEAVAPKPATLSKMASVGGGPVFYKANGRAVSLPEDLDRWFEARLGQPRRNTSEAA